VLATIKAKKRSYKEQKELDELPLIIEGLEEKQTGKHPLDFSLLLSALLRLY
jgi:hypothetical protein